MVLKTSQTDRFDHQPVTILVRSNQLDHKAIEPELDYLN